MENSQKHLYSLDALRGVAALAVVFWHWQHLQVLGAAEPTWPPAPGVLQTAEQPFFALLRPLYERGYLAVDLFFILSGFVFFWLYRRVIEDKSISVGQFFLARFSRLYPLHIATLLFTAALEYAFRSLTGQFFVDKANDLTHFIFGLFFVVFTGDQSAFNVPEWSLSIEILIYAMFFVLALRGLLSNAIMPILLVLLGAYLYAEHVLLARALCGFFLGGLVASIHGRILVSAHARNWAIGVAMAASLLWAAALFDNYSGARLAESLGDGFNASPRAGALFVYALLCSTVLAASLAEAALGYRFSACAWLGEASYASYLLHFPLQVALALLFALNVVSASQARSPLALMLYFALLIPLSVFTYRRFERPAQNFIRRRLGARRQSERAAAGQPALV